MLVSEWIAKYNVSVEFKSNGVRTVDNWEHRLWNAYVTNENDYRVRFSFRTGMAIDAPDADSLFLCLSSDARVFEEHTNPNEVMDTFGMVDYEKARDIYDACNETATTLYDWCVSPDMYTELLTSEEG